MNSALDTNLGDWSVYSEDIYSVYLNWIHENKSIEIEGEIKFEETRISYISIR